jgi:hypothetical protein
MDVMAYVIESVFVIIRRRRGGMLSNKAMSSTKSRPYQVDNE